MLHSNILNHGFEPKRKSIDTLGAFKHTHPLHTIESKLFDIHVATSYPHYLSLSLPLSHSGIFDRWQ